MDTCIVVPCYNEAKRLPTESYRRFTRTTREITLLFVDDGSTDQTRSMLNALARESPRTVSVVSMPKNSGKAEAVRRGMILGIRAGFSKVGYWDADLATPLDAIYDFVDVMNRHPQCELVLGSRMTLLGRAIHRNPRRQRLAFWFSTMASLVLGIPIQDTQCGAKLFRVNDQLRQLLEAPFDSRWIFDVELLARMKCLIGSSRGLRQKLYEFPLDAWEDIDGSKLTIRDMMVAPLELLRIYVNYLAPWSTRFAPSPSASTTIEPNTTIAFPAEEASSQESIRNAA